MTVKEMREKQAPLVKEIRQLADKANDANEGKGREFTAEERARWDEVNKLYNDLQRDIERTERVEDLEAKMQADVDDPDIGRGDFDGRNTDPDGGGRSDPNRGDDAPTEEDRCLALQAWACRNLDAGHTDRHREACRRLDFNPARSSLAIALHSTALHRRMTAAFRGTHPSLAGEAAQLVVREARDLSAVTGSTGGYTVPEGFINALEINLLAFGGMLQVADMIRTDNGADLPWPTADDTGNTGEILGESASVGSSVDPSMGQVVFKAFKFSSKLVKIPVELLEDSAFDMASVIGAMLGQRLGRISNTRFTTGTGSNQPRGLTIASTLGKTTASATAIAFDELFDLEHSVDPAYRTGSGVGYMCHDGILLALRKLKDSEGRYLWTSGTQAGVPDRLNGYRLTINQDMQATVATATITIEFGMLDKYKVRQVRGVRFVRLNERFADNDQVAFIAFLRQDGNLLDAGTAPVKHMLQA